VVEVLVVTLSACIAALYVVIPLLRDDRARFDGWGPALEHEARKNAVLLAILDLEAEREANRLSAEEFEALQREYERVALAAIKELDVLREARSGDDPLEAEIASLRTKLSCPICGGVREPGGACTTCGG
jgi:hypothetical protein